VEAAVARRRLEGMEAASASSAPITTLQDVPHLAPAPAPLLRLSGIVKHWRTLERPVLDHVDLDLGAGQAVHISGRNGVGKTTLLRIVTGLIMPDRGGLELNGLDPERDRVDYQRQVAFLPAGDRGLYARLSVKRHLDFWCRVGFVPRERRRALVAEALERFHLTELASRRVDRLSMGQRQRVRLAGLLLHDPRVVMLDEPLNSLDDEGIELVISVTRDVVARGGIVIWCSPAGERTGLDFDCAYVLEGGKLVQR
jgi:ABC-2 type transport system ATP-binding protein